MCKARNDPVLDICVAQKCQIRSIDTIQAEFLSGASADDAQAVEIGRR
jgi:hypothetical protein